MEKEWVESWQHLCRMAKIIEEDCVQERARIKASLESDSGSPSPVGSEDTRISYDEPLWSEVALVRSQVQHLQPVAPPEQTESCVEIADLENVRSKLQECKEQQQKVLIQIESAEEDLNKALEGMDTMCRSFVAPPSARMMRSLSAGSLSDRRWRGPCGGDGGIYQSGRLLGSSLRSSPSTPGRSRVACKTLMKEDEVLKNLHAELLALSDEIRQADPSPWPEAEHEAFMRVFRMFRMQSPVLVCDRLVERFPSVALHEIESHLKWCVRLEEKQSMKRELLSKWRERIVHLSLEETEIANANTKEESLRASGLSRSRSLAQKKLLEEWHHSKAEASVQAAALERKIGREKAKQEKEETKKIAKKRERQKTLLNEFQQKRSKVLEEKRAEASKRPAPVLADICQRIESRTAEMLQKRYEALASNQLAGQKAETCKKNPKYVSVKSRLFEATESWIAKARSSVIVSEIGEELEHQAPCPSPLKLLDNDFEVVD